MRMGQYDWITIPEATKNNPVYHEQFGKYISLKIQEFNKLNPQKIKDEIFHAVYVIDVVDQGRKGMKYSLANLYKHEKMRLENLSPETNLRLRWAPDNEESIEILCRISGIVNWDKKIWPELFDNKERCSEFLDVMLPRYLVEPLFDE